MGYLVFNEDLKTVAHNYLSSAMYGYHSKNNKNINNFLIPIHRKIIGSTGDKLSFDRKYFDSMYTITPQLKKKLLSWVSNIKGARAFTNDERKMFIDKDTSNVSKISKGGIYRDELTNQNNLASNKTRLATRSLGDGHFTTCTAVYYLPSGKGSYIIYFTFDGDSIEDAKVLCNKDNSESAYNNTGLSDKNFFVKEIPQWKSVRPEEYKK